ncbi:MAG: AraC family transcriptional regulator [Caldimonas sp.]
MHQSVAPGPTREGGTAGAPALVFRTVLRGAACLSWRNRRVRLDEDTWLVLPGGEPCAIEAWPLGGADVLAVAIPRSERDAALALAADLFAAAGDVGEASIRFADNLRPRQGPVGRCLVEIAQGRVRAWSEADEREHRLALMRDACIEEIALRRKAAGIACVKPTTREQLLRRILVAADFIASRHDEPISLDDMARAASLSRYHFVRLFSSVHGETPHAFLRRKRVAVARRHLATGGDCGEAASRAGFGSRSALFRNLRKSTPHGASHGSCCPSA